jgi:hypothetical protein
MTYLQLFIKPKTLLPSLEQVRSKTKRELRDDESDGGDPCWSLQK